MITKKQILQKIQELTDFVKGDEYEQLKKDSEELKTTKELISNVKFSIKDINYFDDTKTIQIRYELPVINLFLDENGEVNKDNFFYSSNMLEMISLQDMKKVQDFIESCKLMERNK